MSGNQVPPGLRLLNSLRLDSCPHCGIAHPYIAMQNQQGHWLNTSSYDGIRRTWGIYACSTCGKLVVATGAPNTSGGTEVTEIYPVPKSVAEEIPDEPKRFLAAAITCLHAPTAAIICSASAIDAMLKEKGYAAADKNVSLNTRINQAVASNLLTKEMGEWAHHVRLEANDQRHADINAVPPTREQAEQTIEFTEALAEILYVLPSRVTRGIARTQAVNASMTSISLANMQPQLKSS